MLANISTPGVDVRALFVVEHLTLTIGANHPNTVGAADSLNEWTTPEENVHCRSIINAFMQAVKNLVPML